MTHDNVHSKLAILLHADVVGSSTLVRTDERLAHRRIQDAFHRLAEIVATYHGAAHEIRGDALVAEFSKASDAVAAALAFQASNASHNDTLEGTVIPVVRVGIAMGEVIIGENTITGEGVILAQRLEQLAEPGGVVVQGAARETVPERLPFIYEDLGERRLKGFERLVRAYRVTGGREADSPRVERAGDQDVRAKRVRRDYPAIAVLPFDNMSGDPEQEYLSDGISEDIITALSYFRSFPVIARNSTFTYKGRAVRVQQVAEELGAGYILEGSVRKSGNRLRITAQLIDAETGHHVWAGKFDRTVADVFDIQDEITRKIVAAMEPELAQAEIGRAAVKRPESLSAWDLVLKGLYFVNRYTVDDFERAREYFSRAIDIDPGYCDAWAGLGWSFLRTVELLPPDERRNLAEEGLKAAKNAVELDTHSSVAHYVLGLAYVWSEQFQAAISEAEIALELNPFNAQAQRGLGNRLDLIGRSEEGIDNMERALALNPRDPNCPKLMGYLCRAHISVGQIEKALSWIEKAIALRPENPDLRYRHAVCLAHLDRVSEANEALSECERLQPGFLAKREHWRPYSDSERNKRFFAGVSRHRLLPESYYE